MILAIREFYAGRTVREQRLLLLMTVIAVPLLLYLLVVVPLGRAYDSALERQLEAVDRNGRVRALVEAERTAGPAVAAPATGADLSLVVAEAAAQAGLTVDSNAPSGPNVAVIGIAQARSSAAIQLLRDFELRGIRVDDVRMTPAGDGTVSLTARLTRGGA